MKPAPCPRRAAAVALLAGLAAGCELRDEEPRSGPAGPWPATVGGGLDQKAAVASGPTDRGIEYVDGFAAGSRRASDTGRPLLLVFRAGWCRWSGELMARTAADRQLAALADGFVCASVDADREADICRSFGISAFPTVVLLDRGRRERFRATGGSATDGLTAALQAVLREPGRVAGGRPAPR